MKALQCEFCGGKLIAKAEGIFECTFCGMLYDRSRIQEMVQEIAGTVKIEGPVEVQGKVHIEGTANADSLIKRGYLMLEDGDWGKAKDLFDRTLDSNPECAEAYVGELLAKLHITKVEDLEKSDLQFFDTNDWRKAIRFADSNYMALLRMIELNWKKHSNNYLSELEKMYGKYGDKIVEPKYIRIIHNSFISRDIISETTSEKDLMDDISHFFKL